MRAVLKKTDLAEMMSEREIRAGLQAELLSRFNKPVLSLGMNIAGDIKSSPAIDFIFNRGVEIFEAAADFAFLHKERRYGPCGPHALLCCDAEAQDIKKLAVLLEDGVRPPGSELSLGACGRLFDFDVIDENGCKLSRPSPRSCIVCGGPALYCSRSREHGLEKIREVTEKLIIEFMSPAVAELATESLKYEARLTPKPGLVDSANNGAHKDMNLGMFVDSAEVLSEHFKRFFVIGAREDDCISELIEEGKKAEAAMFAATGGANTHLGAIFSFALFLASYGGYSLRGGDLGLRIISLAQAKKASGDIHGTHRGGRALAEALSGYPAAFKAAGLMELASPHRALCSIMAELDDSNLLFRGGEEALAFIKSEAERLLNLSDDCMIRELSNLDSICIERNLSPGGAADMFALSVLIFRLKASQ